MERLNLAWVLSEWEAPEDSGFNGGSNNRGGVYIRALIPAAVELIRMNIVGVVTKDPELRSLSEDDAVAVVEDINNWWRYEQVEGVDDPLDPGPLPNGLIRVGDWRSEYTLTHINQDHWTLSSWEWPRKMERLLG